MNYGTSDSLYGPITYQYTLLEKDASLDILGTGHQSILKIPGEDTYYIAYHRFVTPLGQYSSGFGYHRETCIDKLEFDDNNLMKVVTPTLEGIAASAVPEVPAGLSAKTLDSASINLTWTTANEALRYNVYRAQSANGTFSKIGSTGATSFTDKGLAKRTTYYYKITAVNKLGESEATQAVYATTKGGGSHSHNSKVEPPKPEPAEPAGSDIFNDVGKQYSWASEAIDSLATAGIINGTSSDTFDPQKKTTRADFVTLLVRALDLKADASGNFADVDEDAYYYEALAIAKNLGIAQGTMNGEFNPSGEISREDMMVLAVRALKAAGKTLTTDTDLKLDHFSDAAQVSGYAQDSTAALIQAGIIQGDGTSIHPKDTATRAEAAVMIYRLLGEQ